jgi:hypothetical protein
MKIALLAFLLAAPGTATQDSTSPEGTVSYQLPETGPLPRTYRVTLAVVDPKNPDWIVGQFLAGAVRTVTAENHGRFTETWNGLDDNFMPVPPGRYGVKGIWSEAKVWKVDGEAHAITPRFVAGASSWMPSPEDWQKPEPFGGDPCGAPLSDVDVGPDGTAVFYYQYLENGTNNPLFDLRKPVGYGQFVRAFNSGGAGGGTSTCTDGKSVWSYSTDGGPKYVYRADGRPFGTGRAQRNNVYRPEGWVTALAYGKNTVYVAERGRIVESGKHGYLESDRDFVDRITMLAAEDGKILGSVPIPRPAGLVARDGTLHVLHEDGGKFRVSAVGGDGKATLLFTLPEGIRPFDLERDAAGRFYYSVPAANKVYQVDSKGALLHVYGKLDRQKPGAYDRETFISPGKLATWTDGAGETRLIVVEQGGPNRASEWSADGKLLREFQSLQTKANDGYACDPEHPSHFYVGGQEHWLTRFKVDPAAGTWVVDAVWPDVGSDPRLPDFDHPRFIRTQGRAYLACARSYNVYRLDGDRWVLSAGIVRERAGGKTRAYAWSDANGNGRVDEEEYHDHLLDLSGHWFRYHGEQWLEDLSLVALPQGGREAWRLAPSGFDARGNPLLTSVEKLFADPVFEARAKKAADAIHGGNELAESYSSDWAQVDGSLTEGFYVNARGGPNFSANEGAQIKIARYVPDGPGRYRQLWRTGRIAISGTAKSGELYGTIHLRKPLNGLLSVIDQSRCGIALYTEEGLYVDTLFPDARVHPPGQAGVYPQPGEFFAGDVLANREDGKIYLALGKVTPMLYVVDGWSLSENPVRPLATVDRTVTLSAGKIADPPERALAVRGGAGVAKVARFSPALGGVALDGSLAGWESCDPVRFESDKSQSVEARCFYDPEAIHLRWHVRLGRPVEPKALEPVERLFTHDRLADTVSLYFQGDPAARPGQNRPGDVRIVFGLFKDGSAVRPALLGMYPKWEGKGTPQTYRTPVGLAEFEHVGLVAGARSGYRIDEDGKGFVLAASIPRASLPKLPPLSGAVRTLVNFEATLGGHNKFWWSDADGSASRETYDEPTEARLYPGSWSSAQFEGLDRGVVVRNWQINGPWGGPGAEGFKADLSGAEKDKGRRFCDGAVYPPDAAELNLRATYRGELSKGYWHDPGEVRWKPAATAELDTRVVLGPSAQVWFGASWVHAPEEMDLDFVFQGHPQTSLRFSLNGETIFSGEMKEEKGKVSASKRVHLKKGWNEVRFRGFCVGYPPFRAGLIVTGSPEQLWKLGLSAVPPDAK